MPRTRSANTQVWAAAYDWLFAWEAETSNVFTGQATRPTLSETAFTQYSKSVSPSSGSNP